MNVENDIDKLNEYTNGKVINHIERDYDGIIVHFTDGTKLKFRCLNYQTLID